MMVSRPARATMAAAPSAFLTGHNRQAFVRATGLRSRRQVCRAGRGGALTSQMNIFERVSRVIRSYVNAAVSAAEDPEKIIEQSVQDLQSDLIKMRQAAAQVMASTKQLEKRVEQADKTSAEWYKRAQLAVQKGEDELAKEALKRKKTYADNAESLRSQLVQQKQIMEKLLNDTRKLESKVTEAKSKKDTLKARAQSAKASRALADMTSGIDTTSSLAAFEKMEEKVMSLEAEADAASTLSGDTISGQFAMLETGDDVDDELSAMKQNMLGTKKVTAELPGSVMDIEIEAELKDLKKEN